MAGSIVVYTLQAAFRQPLPAKLLHELLPDFFLEVLPERLFAAECIDELDLLLRRALECLVRDDLLLAHCVQDERATRQRPGHAHGRRIHRRRVDETREQRGFSQVQIGRRLPEVSAGRRFSAVETVAEIDLVQIELEDLILRIHALDPPGEGDFLDLPP